MPSVQNCRATSALLVPWIILITAFSMNPTDSLAEDGASAQTCSSTEHRAFDFWVGEWDVSWAKRKTKARNSIRKVANGCAIAESWEGWNGHRGESLSFYDSARKTWHQTWIDSVGEPLYLDGGIEGDSMVMFGTTGSGEDKMYHRVTWTLQEGGRVRQHWQQSKDQRNWTSEFDGIYERADR